MQLKIIISLLLIVIFTMNCVMTKTTDTMKKAEMITEVTCDFRATVTNVYYSGDNSKHYLLEVLK